MRILLEEYSGTPGVPGQYAWAQDLSTGEAETVLRDWLRGELPPLEGWTRHGALRPHLAAGNGASKPGPLPRSAPAPSGLALGDQKRDRVSFVDLLTKKRIETARELVLGSSMKMREIAERCGYSDQHYFSYCFKKYCGVFPMPCDRRKNKI